jgi:hypothetical protein
MSKMCLKKRQNAPGRVHVSAPTQVTKISPILCPPDPRPRDGGGTGGDRRTETQPLYHPSTPTACSASTGISTHSRAHAVTNPHTKGDVACEGSQSRKRREVEPASHAAAVEGAAAAAEEVGSRSPRWRSERTSASSPWTSTSLPRVSSR